MADVRTMAAQNSRDAYTKIALEYFSGDKYRKAPFTAYDIGMEFGEEAYDTCKLDEKKAESFIRSRCKAWVSHLSMTAVYYFLETENTADETWYNMLGHGVGSLPNHIDDVLREILYWTIVSAADGTYGGFSEQGTIQMQDIQENSDDLHEEFEQMKKQEGLADAKALLDWLKRVESHNDMASMMDMEDSELEMMNYTGFFPTEPLPEEVDEDYPVHALDKKGFVLVESDGEWRVEKLSKKHHRKGE